jgi:gliding motility-associated-like protein
VLKPETDNPMKSTHLLHRTGLVVGIALSGSIASAQVTVNPQTDLVQLAESISGRGVQISNPSITCHEQGFGEFSYSGSLLGLESGVILTSGRITDAIGPNDVENKTFQQGTSGSTLLNTVTGRSTRDACLFEFDIIPSGDSISFQFVFGSEEYNEWVGSQFNDVFGFFISGPGITGDPGIGNDRNIALIPGTSAPVAINSVNAGQNSAYYQYNAGGQQLQMDGYTTGLVARSQVQPCQSYHLKLVVADASDRKFDSWVFVERIQSPTITLSTRTLNGSDDMVEGCNPGWIRFTREPVRPTPLTLQYFLQGTATNGTDYSAIGNVNPNVAKTITIPAGQAFAEQPVNPVADAAAEPTEYLRVLLGNPNCPGFVIDSIDFAISDTLIATLSPVGTQTICLGSGVPFQVNGGANYAWSPAAGLSCTNCPNPVASPVVNTNYTVVISDGTCSRTISRLVRVSNPAITGTVTQPLCDGSTNGAINISVNGGYAPYTYSWTGPNGFNASSEDLVNIGAGSYTVEVTDAFGCIRTQGFNLGSPAPLSITLSPSILPFGQNIACNGASTGTIGLSIAGGTGPYTTQWSGPNGFTSSSQNLAGLAAGTYNVSVADANGCNATGGFTLVQSAPLGPSISNIQHATCAGSSNGSATASIAGGMPPYSFTWNSAPPQSSATANGLGAGNYTVTITDGYGCTTQATTTITQPAAVSVSLTGTSHVIHCQGQSQQQGTATAVAAGGNGAFTYSWNTAPAQTAATALFSSGGTYTVTATDGNGCTGSTSFTANQPGTINTNIVAQGNVSCFGGSNGSATVSVTGGSNIQSAVWNTSPVQNGFTAIGLQEGTWTLTATHADGCITQVPVTIAQPAAALAGSIGAQTNVNCFDASTGSATVNASGGTAPYSFSWNTSPAQNGATANNLPTGSWVCTITDANGCSTTRNVTITQPAAALATSISAQANVGCFGASTGSTTVSANGGTAPYSFSWNTSPVQNGAIASNLPAGTWTCTVTDANGCGTTRNVTIAQPADALAGTIGAQTNVSCFGTSTGSASLTASGGTAPYSYSWNSSPVQSGATATNLPAGNWTCTIADANGCSTALSVTITQPAAALASTISAQTNVGCFSASTGSATVSATGGTAPYSFSWNTSPVQNDATANNLPTGTWTCTITDANGCSTTRNVNITQPAAALAGSIGAQTNVNCFGASTGSATVNASGGTAPYSFSWNTSPVQNGATANNLPAGIWTCTITDANGCSTMSNASIAQPAAALTSSIGAQTNAGCFGASTGSATVSASGGTAPYSFSWNTSPPQNSATATNLPAGAWTCTITDANGCSITRNVNITQPAAALASIIGAQTNVNCFSASTGSATVSSNGGTAPYSYSWNTLPVQNGATATNLTAGTWTCTITDANGCSTASSAAITQPAAALASSIGAQTNVSCSGASTGSVSVTASGGTAPYTFSWNTSPVQNDGTATNLTAGTWTCTITDANGCSTMRNVTITQPAAALSITGAITAATCGGASNGAVDASLSGGTAPYTIAWSGPGGFASTSEEINSLISGVYTLQVTDANGCSAIQPFSVNQPGMFIIDATLSDHNGFGVSCADGSNGSINITASGGTGPYTHAWTGPDGFTASTQSISAAVPGNYTYTITDSNGCSAAESFTLTAPPALGASLTSATANGGWHIACHGAATGSIDAVIGGGLVPLGIAWSGPGGFASSNEDIAGLTAGGFTLTVTDGNGCVATASITLTQPAPLGGSTSIISNATCNGASNGIASASVTGGTSPYTYLWNTAPAQAWPVATGLIAGTYDCVISDANGCSTTVQATIGQPNALAVNITGTTDVLCHDGLQGTAQALANGGTAPYFYSWNSAPAQLTANAAGLPQGNYTVSVLDANGCTAQADATIGGPQFEVWAYAESVTHESCFGLSDGSATLDVSGGSGSYTITWNTTPPQSGLTATGLAPGLYMALVVDNNGCDHEKFVPVEILGAAAPLQAQFVTSQITCAGMNNGSINLTLSGGLAPYSPVWSDDFGNSNGIEDLFNLSPGTYHLQASDALGCLVSASIVITQPAPISASVTISPAACQGSLTGAIDLTVAGGTAPYSYIWSSASGFSASTQDISGIGAGTYIVIVIDANGCQFVNGYTVSQPGGLQAGLNITDHNGFGTTCAGASDGAINLSAQGGSGSYSFSWTGPTGFASTNEDISNLAPGSYTVQVTDGNGCSLTLQATITAPDALTASTLASSANGFGLSCNGGSDGAINLIIGGGAGPFSTAWSGPNGFNSSAASISGLSAGDYAVNIIDANGCSTSASITLTEPPALIANATAFAWPDGTNISCASSSDGTIDLSIAGGVGPYSIAWSDGLGYAASTEDISGLLPGGYQAVVTDANGCTANALAVLTAPAPLLAIAQAAVINNSNVSCQGAMDGSIELTATGGTGPFSYAWSNGAITEDLMNLGAGSYSVTLTDAHGCTATTSITLNEPQAIVAVAAASQLPSCNGASDGAIDVSVAGGEAPLSFLWSGPNGYNTNDASPTGLLAGAYSVLVTDAHGCTASALIDLIEPLPVTASITATLFTGGYTIPCAGLSIGSAAASATGGTEGYTFAWSGPDGYSSNDAQLFGLSAGAYTVIATDANGCTGSASVQMVEPQVLDVLIDIADLGGFPVSCNGSDGSASALISGGQAPYFVGWTGPNGFASTLPSITGLDAGDYELTVIDANGCLRTEAFTLNAPEPMAASFIYTSSACATDANGSIDLDVSGGAAPYSFNWTGPDGFLSSDEDLINLAAGVYQLSVNDALGCNGSFVAELVGPAPINSGTYVSFYGLYNLQCLGDSSGVIELAPVGGSAPFTVDISGPGGFTSSSLVNNALVAGEYQVTITDLNGCVMDTLVTLTEPSTQVDAQLSVSVYPSGTNVSCFGASDGWIDAEITGGTGPYVFDWRGPDSLAFSSEDIFNLPAGTYAYELVVTDANQCAFATTVTLTQPDSALQASAVLSTYNGYGVNCAGSADGSIDLSYSGGNGGYVVLWNGPNGFSSNNDDLSGLTSGTYTVTITDMNGCTITQDHVIDAPQPISATLTPSDFNGTGISCAGAIDGTIAASISGGVGAYTLQWTGPGGFSSNDPQIGGLAAGSYCLSITDANGCAAQSCITLTEPQSLIAEAQSTMASCGNANGAIALITNGGTAPYAFAWSNGGISQNLNNLSSGTYDVLVTDANGCTAQASAMITNTPGVAAQAMVSDVLCNGAATGAIDLEVISGTAPYNFTWSNGSTAEDLLGASGGSYSVAVTDANGCAWNGQWTVTESAAITIVANLSSYTGGFEVSAFGGSDGSVGLLVSGGAEPYSYLWSNGSTASNQSGLPAGTYTVTITDANGCTATRSFTLEEPNDLLMPTGFTPNGDGHNDFFVVQGLDAYPGNLLTVLNRWGNVVMEQLNYKNDWAGDNAKGEPLPNGTYFVILSINNGQRTLQGYVDLRR